MVRTKNGSRSSTANDPTECGGQSWASSTSLMDHSSAASTAAPPETRNDRPRFPTNETRGLDFPGCDRPLTGLYSPMKCNSRIRYSAAAGMDSWHPGSKAKRRGSTIRTSLDCSPITSTCRAWWPTTTCIAASTLRTARFWAVSVSKVADIHRPFVEIIVHSFDDLDRLRDCVRQEWSMFAPPLVRIRTRPGRITGPNVVLDTSIYLARYR